MPCITTPAYPAVIGRPSYVAFTPILAWDAGANTINTEDGDCYFQWSVNNDIVGGVAGFSPPNRDSWRYGDLTHAFFIVSVNGARAIQVIENGQLKGSPLPCPAGAVLYIRRVRGVVEYFINSTRVYTSTTRSTGTIRGGSVLYASGDKII